MNEAIMTKQQLANWIRSTLELATSDAEHVLNVNQVVVTKIPGEVLQFHIEIRELSDRPRRFFLVRVSEPL